MNYIEQENEDTKKHFSLHFSEILEFTDRHSVEILRGGDFMYMLYVDGEGGFGLSCTPLNALWYGIEQYKKLKLKLKDKG